MVAGGDRHDANREFVSWLKQARVRAGDPSDKWIEQDSGIPHSTVHDWTSSKGKRKRLPDWDKQVAPLLVSLSQYADSTFVD